jgi:hypothetical protein
MKAKLLSFIFTSLLLFAANSRQGCASPWLGAHSSGRRQRAFNRLTGG